MFFVSWLTSKVCSVTDENTQGTVNDSYTGRGTRHVLRASYGTHFDLIWSSPQVNMGFISGLCGRTPACCLDQAPPGEMWADGPPCSPSGPERSTVAMVRLQVHHWVRTKTFARLRNIFKTFLLQLDDSSTEKTSTEDPCSRLSVTDKRTLSRKNEIYKCFTQSLVV